MQTSEKRDVSRKAYESVHAAEQHMQSTRASSNASKAPVALSITSTRKTPGTPARPSRVSYMLLVVVLSVCLGINVCIVFCGSVPLLRDYARGSMYVIFYGVSQSGFAR